MKRGGEEEGRRCASCEPSSAGREDAKKGAAVPDEQGDQDRKRGRKREKWKEEEEEEEQGASVSGVSGDRSSSCGQQVRAVCDRQSV